MWRHLSYNIYYGKYLPLDRISLLDDISHLSAPPERDRAKVKLAKCPQQFFFVQLSWSACSRPAESAITGCNTVSGVGKDVQAAGSAMSNTAQDAKEEMTD
jgi:hypothetical protein